MNVMKRRFVLWNTNGPARHATGIGRLPSPCLPTLFLVMVDGDELLVAWVFLKKEIHKERGGPPKQYPWRRNCCATSARAAAVTPEPAGRKHGTTKRAKVDKGSRPN